jgi:DNA-damage-inducible protein J
MEKTGMPKTSTVFVRVDPKLKENVDRVFKELGLTSAQTITLFYRQVELRQGLPFSVRLPNPNVDTVRAIEDAKNRRNLETFNDTDALFEDLDISIWVK